jgi:hypothetical protein
MGARMSHPWPPTYTWPDYLTERVSIHDDHFACTCGTMFAFTTANTFVKLCQHALGCATKPRVDSNVRECPMCHATRPRAELVCLPCQRAAQIRMEQGKRV